MQERHAALTDSTSTDSMLATAPQSIAGGQAMSFVPHQNGSHQTLGPPVPVFLQQVPPPGQFQSARVPPPYNQPHLHFPGDAYVIVFTSRKASWPLSYPWTVGVQPAVSLDT